MNDYKIFATLTGGEDIEQTITARTESEAQRYFKAAHKGTAADIFEITLIRENTTATKQQQRDTLEAIKKMVEELGPQSYLATAFEGAFEDAEINIENDFADSMKARWEDAEKRLGELNRATTEEINRLRKELSESEKDYDAAHAEIAVLRKRTLTPDDLTDVIHLVTEKRVALDTEVKNAAERIVEAAAEPESAAFQNAVKDHRAAKSDLEYYTALLTRTDSIQKAS
ncbi:hypothetical protein [Acutalibacter sp. 1XD8-36]|uniref:hypothetical protein n=1 Tax=Acutalibacter sp. 1XD8-36 TaxID=2320852 RepID=UPI0013724AFE|nr:hypothetical protein [Acutalibacter sp. 1XD8-36]